MRFNHYVSTYSVIVDIILNGFSSASINVIIDASLCTINAHRSCSVAKLLSGNCNFLYSSRNIFSVEKFIVGKFLKFHKTKLFTRRHLGIDPRPVGHSVFRRPQQIRPAVPRYFRAISAAASVITRGPLGSPAPSTPLRCTIRFFIVPLFRSAYSSASGFTARAA